MRNTFSKDNFWRNELDINYGDLLQTRYGINSILSIPIPFCQFQFHIKFINSNFYLLLFTKRKYSKQFIYIYIYIYIGLSWKKYFWIKQLNGKLNCGFNFFIANFISKFLNSIFFKISINSKIELAPCVLLKEIGSLLGWYQYLDECKHA